MRGTVKLFQSSRSKFIHPCNSLPTSFAKVLSEIEYEIPAFQGKGKVASYIPELAKIDGSKFGMHLATVEGGHFSIGDSMEKFSIQSISKVFTLALAVSQVGSVTFDRVGVEPSGTAFNSLVQLEHENGIPRNPFINAGAIVMCDILIDQYPNNPKEEILSFIRRIAHNESIDFNPDVAQSEWDTGYRNRALANFMKSFGNIHNDIDRVLDLYFFTCSIEMTCKDLATAFGIFANEGVVLAPPIQQPTAGTKASGVNSDVDSSSSGGGGGRGNNQNEATGFRVLPKTHVRRINSVMQTCGFYDEAGEFSYRIGLPGKSGVGGGIVAVHPRKYAVAVWSPRLNEKGNSATGMKALELLVDKLDCSIF